jgi:hypothetical protein
VDFGGGGGGGGGGIILFDTIVFLYPLFVVSYAIEGREIL